MPAERRRPGRPATLSSEQIVTTATNLVSETGELQMGELGSRLGVDPSAVYRYFRNRSHLVSAIAESFTRPLCEYVPTTGNWRSDVEAHVRRIEAHYRAQPSLALLVMGESDMSGASLDIVRIGLQLLRGSGAPDRCVFTAGHAIEVAVYGSITYDTIGAPLDDEVRRKYHRQLGVMEVDDLYPTAAELQQESSDAMWILITGVLDWLERQAARRPG